MPIAGKLLTFDLAANTGYAMGDPDALPTFSTIVFEPTGMNIGRHQRNVRAALSAVIDVHQPALVGFEQPSLFAKTTPATMRKLICYGNTLEEICDERGICCREINPSTLKKFWTGKGKAEKSEMVARARACGFAVKNDDEADAIACWFYMVHCYGSEEQKRRFEQMFFETGMGREQARAF